MENRNVPRPTALAPGVFHQKLGGDNEAWILDDGFYECDPARDCAWNAPKSEVAAILSAAHLPGTPIRLHVLPVLLRWNGEYLLLDAGAGTAYGPGLGHIAKRLASIGVSLADIRGVLFSHLHLDHVAGALDLGARKIIFPNAQFFAAAGEIQFWNQPRPDTSGTRIPAEQVEAILAAIRTPLEVLNPRFVRFNPGDEVRPGIRAIATPGHTANHVAFEIISEEMELVYAGDALIEPSLHVPHPEWLSIGDMAPSLVAESRRKLYARAAERRQGFIGYHFSLPGMGTVREVGKGNYQFASARFDAAEA